MDIDEVQNEEISAKTCQDDGQGMTQIWRTRRKTHKHTPLYIYHIYPYSSTFIVRNSSLCGALLMALERRKKSTGSCHQLKREKDDSDSIIYSIIFIKAN